MGSDCCKFENKQVRELYTLETLETEIGQSKSYTSIKNQKQKNLIFFQQKKNITNLIQI